ncbi:sensor histidine kinase, partial [Paenibacillus sp. TAF58]
LHVHIKCDPRIEFVHIPKLLLQPLVENAIIHGIEPLKRPGHLEIRVDVQEDKTERWLHVCIQDNGVGFEIKKMVNSVGITNVRERLLIFDSDTQFTIQSTKGEGARVEILIPWKDADVG